MSERKAFVLLAIFAMVLSGLSVWISIAHDKADSAKFCSVIENILLTTRPKNDGGQEASYERWVRFGRTLDCHIPKG